MSSGTITLTATGDSSAVQKNPQENYTTFTVIPLTAYTGLIFTTEGSVDGTNYEKIPVVDLKTGLLIAGGTAISPTDGTTHTYVFSMAQNYTKYRVNTSQLSTNTAKILVDSATIQGSPLFTSIAGGAGSWTNGTFSGTLGVTGATTLSSTLAVTGAATFSSTVATGALTVTGAATVSTTLVVTGALSTSAGFTAAAGAVIKTSGATAITTTRAVTKADSGGVFTTAQSSAYTVTVAQPASAGERYIFQLVSPGAFDISIVATGCTFEGTITIDAATIPSTGSTLKFASGAAILGDSIELIATSTTKFLVRAISSGAGGITIS